MRKLCLLNTIWLFFSLSFAFAQTVTVEGYVFEEGNRGYLNVAKVTFLDQATQSFVLETATNMDGVFKATLPAGRDYLLKVEKDLFKSTEQVISTLGKTDGEKIFVKIQMQRKPGYIFDVTIAEKRSEDGSPADAVSGARIEVYNNTKEKEELSIDNHPIPTFKTHFEEGNHYTVLIRKQGYFNKRLEAYVNVKGCILCFEGVGNVKPSDVLTEGHSMGTLLANVELQPVEIGKGMKLENIYYDYNAYDIRKDAGGELDKLIAVLKNNPSMIVELGSHTDSRGKDGYNLSLSEKRAQAAVDYILKNSNIDPQRIQAKGYGETQLVNKCKNDVRCSETQHQDNRRTELKIVGFLSEDPYASRSLAQIIEEEKYAKLLAEIGNSEVIRVPADGELPSELQQQFETQAKQDAMSNGSTNPSVNTEPVIPSYSNTTPMITYTPTPEPAPSTSSPTVTDSPRVTSIPPPPPSEASPTTSATTGRRPYKPQLEETPDKGDFQTSPESFEEGFMTDLGKDNSRIVSTDLAVNASPTRVKALPLPADYTGYRIEFFAAPFELPISHEIFSRHGNVTYEQKKDGTYAYLLGDFEDWRDANKFLTNILVAQYPDARVVRYKKGRRLLE